MPANPRLHCCYLDETCKKSNRLWCGLNLPIKSNKTNRYFFCVPIKTPSICASMVIAHAVSCIITRKELNVLLVREHRYTKLVPPKCSISATRATGQIRTKLCVAHGSIGWVVSDMAQPNQRTQGYKFRVMFVRSDYWPNFWFVVHY